MWRKLFGLPPKHVHTWTKWEKGNPVNRTRYFENTGQSIDMGIVGYLYTRECSGCGEPQRTTKYNS